ncbi:hypothetical protein GN956_G24351 [Arapaima gigas]
MLLLNQADLKPTARQVLRAKVDSAASRTAGVERVLGDRGVSSVRAARTKGGRRGAEEVAHSRRARQMSTGAPRGTSNRCPPPPNPQRLV